MPLCSRPSSVAQLHLVCQFSRIWHWNLCKSAWNPVVHHSLQIWNRGSCWHGTAPVSAWNMRCSGHGYRYNMAITSAPKGAQIDTYRATHYWSFSWEFDKPHFHYLTCYINDFLAQVLSSCIFELVNFLDSIEEQKQSTATSLSPWCFTP